MCGNQFYLPIKRESAVMCCVYLAEYGRNNRQDAEAIISLPLQIWPTYLSRSCRSCWRTQTPSTRWMEMQLPCTFTGQRSTSRKSKVQTQFRGVSEYYWVYLSFLCLVIFSFCSSIHRVHSEICNRGSSEGARRGGRWLFIRKLHVWLLRRRGPGHGVVVIGGLPHPAPSFNPPQRLYLIS